MSNQKITELNSLTANTIDDADLFPVVDVSSNTSPTGETKNISTSQLVTRIVNDAIDQIAFTLSDTSKLVHSHSIEDVTLLRDTLNGFVSSSQIGQPDGIVPLNIGGKISTSYLPDELTGSNFVMSVFGRSGNVVAGSNDYNGIYIPISSINVSNGVAGLDVGNKVDVSNLPAGLSNGVASLDNSGKVPLDQLPDLLTGSFPVTQFNGRTGTVIPQSNDYVSFYISQSGGTLTGQLNVLVVPTQPSHSVSKQYVDTVSSSLLSLSGGTMSGHINVQILPTQPSHSVSKQYVDSLNSEIGIKRFMQNDVGGGRQCHDGFVCIDKEDNVRVIGSTSSGQKFGVHDARAPAVTLNLPRSASKVYANYYNVFIITDNNQLYSSGKNTYGQCGINGSYNNNIKIPTLTSISNVTKVALSSDSNVTSYMFLTSNGTVYSCGENNSGQLGIGTTTDTNASGPTLSIGPGNTYGNPTLSVVDIMSSGGGGYTTFIALLSDGSVYCVGYGGYGQMGDGTSTSINTTWKRVTITGGSNISSVNEIQISGGQSTKTSCYAKTSVGDLYSWGYNGYGQLGVGDTSIRNRGTKINSSIVSKFWPFGSIGQLFVKYDSGDIHTCGYNYYGQLGLGDTTNRSSLTLCSSLTGLNIDEIYSGNHSFGPSSTWAKSTGNNNIYSTGNNSQYQLGDGTNTQRNSFSKTEFHSNSTIVDIYSQYFDSVGGYTMILTSDGNIYHTGQSRYELAMALDGYRNYFSKITNYLIG